MIEGIQPLKGLKSSDQVSNPEILTMGSRQKLCWRLSTYQYMYLLISSLHQASVMFKFIKNPEFVKSGARILFREGRTKGIGQVTQVPKLANILPFSFSGGFR